MRNAVQLIAYVDRLAGDLSGMKALLSDELAGLFGGIHLLPYFTPYDGADAGFDPADHLSVDERLGDWKSLSELSDLTYVMSDLIVNHVSDASRQFQDVMRRGKQSEYWELFLKRSDVFPDESSPKDIEQVYRPRPGLPFTNITLDDGTTHEFWTTFSPEQLDINVECPSGRAYLESILNIFAASGIQGIRLDAAGYAIKRRATSCFMLPETFEFIASISKNAAEFGMHTLVEIHSHFQTQIEIATHVDRVYDFALPPLVLNSIYTGNADALKDWLAISPRNCVTVLDTHDGIGILDVAGDGEREGLLSDQDVDRLVETIHENTGGESRRASGHAASNLDIYQVNSTYYDALGRNDTDYLIARAIQFFSPGTPQVYYVGLLAGLNDTDLVERTGVGRDINRHYYSRDEIREALQRSVVKHLMDLIRIRNEESAFNGAFSIPECPPDELILRWDGDNTFAQLHVELGKRRAVIDTSAAGGYRRFIIEDDMLAPAAANNDEQPVGNA